MRISSLIRWQRIQLTSAAGKRHVGLIPGWGKIPWSRKRQRTWSQWVAHDRASTSVAQTRSAEGYSSATHSRLPGEEGTLPQDCNRQSQPALDFRLKTTGSVPRLFQPECLLWRHNSDSRSLRRATRIRAWVSNLPSSTLWNLGLPGPATAWTNSFK